MKINKLIYFLFFVILFQKVHADDLDYVWTDTHPVLTEYVSENKDKIFKYADGVFKNSDEYLPYIYKIAEENNVPKEIAVVAAIESAFNPKAISSAGALGMWQFMEETAKDMGLDSKDRKDWKKSTKAAILYLKWLANSFDGDYELAILAYNGGIGNIKKTINKYQNSDPWFLISKKDLPEETREYLPKFITYVYYYHYIK